MPYRENQKKILECLRKMSEVLFDDEQISEIYKEIMPFFVKGFRYRYAEIFPLVVEIAKDGNGCDLECLSNNLESVRIFAEQKAEGAEDGGHDSLDDKGRYSKLLAKLSDHINLEIGRYNYLVRVEGEFDLLKKETQKVDLRLKRENEKIENARDELEKLRKQMASSQTEIVAILGIFAAIVLSFSGGISVTSSALASLKDVPAYKTILAIIIVGMVLSNIIFMLLYMVGIILDKNFVMNPEYMSNRGKNQTHEESVLKKMFYRMPCICYLNSLFLFFAMVDLAIWLFCIYLTEGLHPFFRDGVCMWFAIVLISLVVLVWLGIKFYRKKRHKATD